MSFRVSPFLKSTRALMASARATAVTPKPSAVAAESPPLSFEINLELTLHSNGKLSSLQIPVKTPSTAASTAGIENADENENETKKVDEEVNNQKPKGKKVKRGSSTEEIETVGSPATLRRRRPRGMLLASPVSAALGEFLGVGEASPNDAFNKVRNHIKLHNLQNPADKKLFTCDAELKTIFEGKDEVGAHEIRKLLAPHFVKTAE